jgi:hypothetical protein
MEEIATTNGQEPETETEEDQEPETENPADETPPAAVPEEPPKPRQPSNEMKVVVIMKDSNIMLGVQSPDCDPVYETMNGSMTDALQRVPALIEKAKQQWTTTPRNPKANLPEPPPPPATTPRSTTSKTTKGKEPEKSTPKFF